VPRSGAGNTLQAVYSDDLVLAVNLASYLESKNLSGAGVNITAVVNQQTIVGVYNGSVYVNHDRCQHPAICYERRVHASILVVGNAQGYKSDSFSLLVTVLPIYSNLSVFVNESYYTNLLSATLFLKDQLSFKVYYESFYNGYQALSQFADIKLVFINDTSLSQNEVTLLPAIGESYSTYDLVLDLNTFKSGLKDFYITAELAKL